MDEKLSRAAASRIVEAIGWRYLLGTFCTSVAVPSLEEAVAVAASARTACAGYADRHLRMDLRSDRVELSLQTRDRDAVTARDAHLAHRISHALSAAGHRTGRGRRRPVQMLEIAIDAMDIAAIRPFWKAVLGYADEPTADDPGAALVDPTRQLPAVWFQQMDAPRPQRNRVHFDVTVAHDEADARVRAALDAGGTLVDDSQARAFWVLADAEGNEACVCTWEDRD